MNRGARQKPIPASSTQRVTPAGPRSTATPSASSTSADPARDEAARLPCLQTFPPAAATTRAARVETLIVPLPSPPCHRCRQLPGDRKRDRVTSDRPDHADHLSGGLPFGPKRGCEGSYLRRRRLAGEYRGHSGSCLVRAQVLPPKQSRENPRPPARRFKCQTPPLDTEAPVAGPSDGAEARESLAGSATQSHHKSWSRTPRAMRFNCT